MNTGQAGHEDLHHLAGAYVLGGLDIREREQFEQHLALCRLCTEELKSLESLPLFLDAVPVEAAVAMGSRLQAGGAAPMAQGHPDDRPGSVERADPAGVGPLMAKMASRRRRSRWRSAALLSGVAAAFLAIGYLAGPAVDTPTKPEVSYTMSAASGPQIQLGLVKKAWGTELALAGRGLPEQGILSLWVKDKTGTYDRAASWSATARGQAEVVGATPVTIEDMAGVEIRDAGGKAIAVLSQGNRN